MKAQVRRQVVTRMLRGPGARMGGSSSISSACPPGMSLSASTPTTTVCSRRKPKTKTLAYQGILARMISITASSGAQGSTRVRSRLAIRRCLRESSMRVVSSAMVTQENPITSGMTPLPLSPILVMNRCRSTEKRGR